MGVSAGCGKGRVGWQRGVNRALVRWPTASGTRTAGAIAADADAAGRSSSSSSSSRISLGGLLRTEPLHDAREWGTGLRHYRQCVTAQSGRGESEIVGGMGRVQYGNDKRNTVGAMQSGITAGGVGGRPARAGMVGGMCPSPMTQVTAMNACWLTALVGPGWRRPDGAGGCAGNVAVWALLYDAASTCCTACGR